jgi:hypothetical protein
MASILRERVRQRQYFNEGNKTATSTTKNASSSSANQVNNSSIVTPSYRNQRNRLQQLVGGLGLSNRSIFNSAIHISSNNSLNCSNNPEWLNNPDWLNNRLHHIRNAETLEAELQLQQFHSVFNYYLKQQKDAAEQAKLNKSTLGTKETSAMMNGVNMSTYSETGQNNAQNLTLHSLTSLEDAVVDQTAPIQTPHANKAAAAIDNSVLLSPFLQLEESKINISVPTNNPLPSAAENLPLAVKPEKTKLAAVLPLSPLNVNTKDLSSKEIQELIENIEQDQQLHQLASRPNSPQSLAHKKLQPQLPQSQSLTPKSIPQTLPAEGRSTANNAATQSNIPANPANNVRTVAEPASNGAVGQNQPLERPNTGPKLASAAAIDGDQGSFAQSLRSKIKQHSGGHNHSLPAQGHILPVESSSTAVDSQGKLDFNALLGAAQLEKQENLNNFGSEEEISMVSSNHSAISPVSTPLRAQPSATVFITPGSMKIDISAQQPQPLPKTIQILADPLEILKLGDYFMAYFGRENTTRKQIFLFYVAERGRLGTFYHSHSKEDREELSGTAIAMDRVSDIFMGKQSRELNSEAARLAAANCCFSVVTKDRALHLQAQDDAVRRAWLKAVQVVLSDSGKAVEDQPASPTAAKNIQARSSLLLNAAPLSPNKAQRASTHSMVSNLSSAPTAIHSDTPMALRPSNIPLNILAPANLALSTNADNLPNSKFDAAAASSVVQSQFLINSILPSNTATSSAMVPLAQSKAVALNVSPPAFTISNPAIKPLKAQSTAAATSPVEEAVSNVAEVALPPAVNPAANTNLNNNTVKILMNKDNQLNSSAVPPLPPARHRSKKPSVIVEEDSENISPAQPMVTLIPNFSQENNSTTDTTSPPLPPARHRASKPSTQSKNSADLSQESLAISITADSAESTTMKVLPDSGSSILAHPLSALRINTSTPSPRFKSMSTPASGMNTPDSTRANSTLSPSQHHRRRSSSLLSYTSPNSLKEGFLTLKKTNKGKSAWTRLYCVLKPTAFNYYKAAPQSAAQKCDYSIYLAGGFDVVKPTNSVEGNEYLIQMKPTGEKGFYLSCGSESDRNHWFTQLRSLQVKYM